MVKAMQFFMIMCYLTTDGSSSAPFPPERERERRTGQQQPVSHTHVRAQFAVVSGRLSFFFVFCLCNSFLRKRKRAREGGEETRWSRNVRTELSCMHSPFWPSRCCCCDGKLHQHSTCCLLPSFCPLRRSGRAFWLGWFEPENSSGASRAYRRLA